MICKCGVIPWVENCCKYVWLCGNFRPITVDDMEKIPKVVISEKTTWETDSDPVEDLIAGYELLKR